MPEFIKKAYNLLIWKFLVSGKNSVVECFNQLCIPCVKKIQA